MAEHGCARRHVCVCVSGGRRRATLPPSGAECNPIAGFGVTVLLPFVARPPPVKDTVALGSAPVLAE
jgi:hypothetical protein